MAVARNPSAELQDKVPLDIGVHAVLLALFVSSGNEQSGIALFKSQE